MLKCVLLSCAIIISVQSSLSAQWIRANGPYGGQGGDIVVLGKSIFASARDGVFESTDEGHSWVARNNGLQISRSVTTCYCLIAKGNQLFLGTNFGVFRSIDSAKSWSFLSYNMALASKAVTHAIMFEGNLLMAGTAAGLLLSSDNGLTWQKSTRFNDTTVTSFAVVGSHKFAGTEHGLYLSTDTGRTWVDRTGILKKSIDRLFTSDSIIYASLSDLGFFFSTDKGLNWSNVSPHFDNRNVYTMIEQGQNIYVGTDSMMFESKNGKEWEGIGPITMQSWVAGVALIQSGILCSSRYDVFSSTDSGVTWDHIVTCLSNTSGVNALTNVNGYLVAGTLEDGVFGSSDNGRHWSLCSMPSQATFYSLTAIGSRLLARSESREASADFRSSESCESPSISIASFASAQ